MPSKVFSGAIAGLDAKLVEVEIDVSHGMRSFTIVGLPDKTVEESKERIESAIKSSKLLSPHQRTFRILVNLAPADLKKEGALYDLPIALAFLIASKQTSFNPAGKLFLGELSLEGEVRGVSGISKTKESEGCYISSTGPHKERGSIFRSWYGFGIS
jgi:magnesium chelatase family protein